MDINTVVHESNISILRIDGKIIGESSNTLKHAIGKQTQDGARNIILDLSAVPLMDSSALGIMVAALTSLKKKGMKLALLNPQKAVSDVLKTTRLDTIFEIYDDEQKAISAFD